MERQINKRIKRDYETLFNNLPTQNKQIFFLLQANLDYFVEALYKKIEYKGETKDLSIREPFITWLKEDAGYDKKPYSRIELKLISYLDMTPNLYTYLQHLCHLEHIEISYESLKTIDNKIWLSHYIQASDSEKDSIVFEVGTTAKKIIDCFCNVLDGWKSHFSNDGVDSLGVPRQFNHWYHTVKVDFSRWLHSYGGKRMSSISFQNDDNTERFLNLTSTSGNPEYDLDIIDYKESVIRELKSFKPIFFKNLKSKTLKETKHLTYLFIKDFMIDSSHYCSKSSGKFKMNTWFNERFPTASKQSFEQFKKLKSSLEQTLYAFMALCEKKEILNGEQVVLLENRLRRYKEIVPRDVSVINSYDGCGTLSRDDEAHIKTFTRNVLYDQDKMKDFNNEILDLNRQEERYFNMLSDLGYFKSLLEELTGSKVKPYSNSTDTFMVSADISDYTLSPRKGHRYNSIMSQKGGYYCYRYGTHGKFDWCSFLGIQPKRGALIRNLAYKKTHKENQ